MPALSAADATTVETFLQISWIMGKDSSRLCQGLRGYPFYQWTRNGKLKSNSRLRSSSRSWSHWETCGQEAFRQPGEPHTLYCAAARPRRQRSMVLTIRSAYTEGQKQHQVRPAKKTCRPSESRLKNYESLKTLVEPLDRSGHRTIQPSHHAKNEPQPSGEVVTLQFIKYI
jgi:hypothetical protein